MTQVTVKELAQVVDTPVERLLLQMRDAGLPHTSAEQVVTDSEKQALLTHLKGSHGDRASEPRKITLQRKTTTTLKVGGSKTVSVEVRKKKTYVKRSPDEIEAERQRELEEQRAAEEAERLKAEEAAARQRAEEEARKAEEAARAKAAQEAAATAGAEPAVVADVAVAEPVAKPAAVEERKKEEPRRVPKRDEDDDRRDRKHTQHRPSVKEKEKVPAPRVAPRSIDEESDGYRRGGRGGKSKLKKRNQHGFQNPTGPIVREVNIGETITVAELAAQMSVKGAEVVKFMFKMGSPVTINQVLDQETAQLVAEELGHKVKLVSENALVQHAKAAGVPIVVAVNKIDKPEANPDNIKNGLAALDVIPEEWGGDAPFVPVSAKLGTGVDELLEAVLLQAEVLELKATPSAPGRGVVVESRLDKGRGPVATVLVQDGTLRQGDMVLVGINYGRVRAMLDENGKPIKEAGPSIPVEILGLDGTPDAGDEMTVVADEKKAREVALFRQGKFREVKLARAHAGKLENIFENMGQEEKKTLNIVLKADVRGSLEALQGSLSGLGNDEVQVRVVGGGVGGITESDANLALASNAVLFGFNVRADAGARKIVEAEGLDMRYYNVIYDIIEDVKKALTGMLGSDLRENILGIAEVRDVFRSPKFGAIAGCMVTEGMVHRNRPIRVLRDDVVIFEGELESLRRFKDDVAEVRAGMECGIGVKSYNDVKVGDKIEVFEKVEVARSL